MAIPMKPGSGYDIKKFCDKAISYFWNENFGHIYPVLKQKGKELLLKLIMYCDIDKLETHLMELSFQDTVVIRELTDAVRKFKDIHTASKDESLVKYSKVTMLDFVQRFKDPFLKEALLAFAPKGNWYFH